jgi:hypothetical protein
MIQLSLDGRRIYVTTHFSADGMSSSTALILSADRCRHLEWGPDYQPQLFFVDFGAEPHDPALGHEMNEVSWWGLHL